MEFFCRVKRHVIEFKFRFPVLSRISPPPITFLNVRPDERKIFVRFNCWTKPECAVTKTNFCKNNAYVGGTRVVDPSCRVRGERFTFVGYNLHTIQSIVTNSNKHSTEPRVRGPSTFAKTRTIACRRRTMCAQRPKTTVAPLFAAGHFGKNEKFLRKRRVLMGCNTSENEKPIFNRFYWRNSKTRFPPTNVDRLSARDRYSSSSTVLLGFRNTYLLLEKKRAFIDSSIFPLAQYYKCSVFFNRQFWLFKNDFWSMS